MSSTKNKYTLSEPLLTYEVTFFNCTIRNGISFTFETIKGKDLISLSYLQLQLHIMRENLENYQGSETNPVEIIQHIIDSNIYSPLFIIDLVKNQHIYSLSELAEKIAPIKFIEPSWSLKSLRVK